MTTRILAAAFLSASLVVPALAAHPTHKSEPMRIVSLTEDSAGHKVAMKLENGSSVEVAKQNVRIEDNTRPARHHKKNAPMSVSSLSEMSASGHLPAVVTLRYRHNGTVRKADVAVFGSDAEAAEYLRHSPAK